MSKSLKKLIDINRLREFKNKLVGTDSAYVQTGAVDQTVAGTKTFSKPIVGSVTGSSGSCTGNAATATTATTAKACTGNAASANIATKATQDAAGNTITTTYATKAENNTKANNSEVVHKSGDETIAGTKTFSNGVLSTAVNAFMAQNKGYTVLLRNDGGSTYLLISDKDGVPGTWSEARPLTISNSTGVCNINGNASTATKLAAKRTIALSGAATGTATGFDGSGNITIPVTSLDASKLTGTASVSTTGNAATATTATTAKACTGNAATASKLATARSLWGNNFDGSAAITGAITGTPAIELMPKATTANNGGFLDFHYNQSTADYTSRIIESASGTLSINNVTITTGKVVTATTFNGALKGNVTGNCSGSSGSCTGNATSATKATQDSDGNQINTTYSKNGHTHDDRYYTEAEVNNLLAGKANTSHTHNFVGTLDNNHAIGLDWGSQVPGHVGLRVDTTDIGGIVTTNRLVSDIRAQWYAAYPDGAEAHNAMWGGRDITAAFNNGTFSANVANGTFKDIFPGDYITKAVTIYGNGTPVTYTVNWVIADCDYWINKGDTATTTHHVAIVPQQPIFDANMNATNTTEGGYKGSVMYRSIIRASVTGGIVSAFGSDHILTFRDGITSSVDTSHVSSGIPQYMGTPGWWGEWVSVQCNLMSEKMVYGAPICSAGAADNTMATRQMSAFRLSERLINYNRSVWWLRDVVSSAYFAFVDGNGNAGTYNASGMYGVRPFALLR